MQKRQQREREDFLLAERQRLAQAAEVKSLGPALLSAWQDWQNPNLDVPKKLGLC